MINPENYIRMSLSELKTPKGGSLCFVDHWWAITDSDEALFYRTHDSPQCNSDKRVLDKINDGRPIKTRSVFVHVAYVPHRCST